MLHNIFLIKGKELQEVEDHSIYYYPKEIIDVNNKILVNNILKCHSKGASSESNTSLSNTHIIPCKNSTQCTIDKPIAQYINGLNIYTSCIDGSIIVGLIFDDDDNPYDYKEIFEELLAEVLHKDSGYFIEDDTEIDNFLISIFIDIRRYGDEVIEKTSEIDYYFQRDSFFKCFLYGIDETGKTSLIRRLQTGEFDDNYFTPTKKFDIQYIKAEEELFAFWDLPGQLTFRARWFRGLPGSNILIYMLDLANQRRFKESQSELWRILNSKDSLGLPLLILCNKIDLIENFNNQQEDLENQIYDLLDLGQIKERKWELLFISVKTNFNINKIIPTILNLHSSKVTIK